MRAGTRTSIRLTSVFATLIVSAIGPAASEESDAGRELLSRAAERAREVTAVAYRARFQQAFLLAKEVWRAEGNVVQLRDSDGPRSVIDATLTPPGTDAEPLRVALVRERDRFRWINHTEKSTRVADHPGLAGVASLVVHELALSIWSDAEPYADAAKPERGEVLRYKNKACSLLTFEGDPARGSERWIMDASNLAPLRVERELGHCCGKQVVTKWELVEREHEAPTKLPSPNYSGYALRTAEAPVDALPTATDTSRLVTLKDAGAFRAAFDAGANKPRLVGLFAPT